MRDYQIRGLNWMISLYEHGINGILADEMVSAMLYKLLFFCCMYLLTVCTAGAQIKFSATSFAHI